MPPISFNWEQSIDPSLRCGAVQTMALIVDVYRQTHFSDGLYRVFIMLAMIVAIGWA